MHDGCTMSRAWSLKGAARLIHPCLAGATPRCSGIRCARSPGGFGVTVSIPWRPPKKPAWTFLIQSMQQSGASSSYPTPGGAQKWGASLLYTSTHPFLQQPVRSPRRKWGAQGGNPESSQQRSTCLHASRVWSDRGRKVVGWWVEGPA